MAFWNLKTSPHTWKEEKHKHVDCFAPQIFLLQHYLTLTRKSQLIHYAVRLYLNPTPYASAGPASSANLNVKPACPSLTPNRLRRGVMGNGQGRGGFRRTSNGVIRLLAEICAPLTQGGQSRRGAWDSWAERERETGRRRGLSLG